MNVLSVYVCGIVLATCTITKLHTIHGNDSIYTHNVIKQVNSRHKHDKLTSFALKWIPLKDLTPL